MNSFRKVTLVAIVDEEISWDPMEDGCDGCGAAPTHRVGRVLLCDNCTEPAPCQCPECRYYEEPTLASEAFDDEWTYSDYLLGN